MPTVVFVNGGKRSAVTVTPTQTLVGQLPLPAHGCRTA